MMPCEFFYVTFYFEYFLTKSYVDYSDEKGLLDKSVVFRMFDL
jgi:hypothetical protein